MSWLRWAQRRCLRAIGWQGIAGLCLVTGCAMAWLGAVGALESEVAALRLEATANHEGNRRIGGKRDADPEAQLQAFYAHFRHDETLETWLARLYDIGERGGLVLREARYEPVDGEGLALSRYRITLPVTSSYPQLRSFLAAALARIPVLSLDHVTLRRSQPGDPRVEAHLQFTLYLPQRI